jgi:hypothetical protein
MKKLLTALLMLPLVSATAQNNPIFYGGAGDGFHAAAKLQVTDNNNSGGAGDGFAAVQFVQSSANTNAGGNGDGWSVASYLPIVSNINKGHYGDGWNTTTYLPTVDNIHKGHYGDGWTNNTNTPYISRVYKGGSGDGWASTYYPLSPLPIEFLSFSATKQNGMALLRWEMGTDADVAYFDVERSAEAVNFTNLGAVQQNAQAEKKYYYTDQTPLRGHNYYRIKVHRKDGSIVYTGIKTVIFDVTATEECVSVFPNPAKDRVNIKVPEGWNNDPIVINILDISGKLVFHQRANYSDLITLDVSSLLPGSYIIQVATEQRSCLAKLNIVK